MSVNYSTNSDDITRDYFNSLMIEPRYIDSDLPSLKVDLFGKTFDTPIMTAALSHLHNICDDAMCEFGRAAKEMNAMHWYGMGSDEELESIIATGADTVKIIKPHADDKEVFRRIEHAAKAGVFAMGMDIDHSFSWNGGYDNVLGLDMRPKSFEQIKAFVEASPVPFFIKGVLSVADAEKCVKAGVKGILLSHHHNIMSCMVPPLLMLPEIKKAVGDDVKIFVDCDIESGFDVFKALALGADAVGVGRAFMGPLKDGSKGVVEKYKEMNCQLAACMARTGSATVASIDPTVIHRRDF